MGGRLAGGATSASRVARFERNLHVLVVCWTGKKSPEATASAPLRKSSGLS